MPAQKSAFLDGEADAYFSRNTSALAANAGLVSFYAEYVRANMRVLEIGCASGANVAAICREKQCQGFGVDPSPLAVGSGKQAYPNISLAVGTADKLNFADAAFDMVLFGFCLYLVDRALLMKVAAESDRVLKDGGFLGLWDFDPIVPTKRHSTQMGYGLTRWTIQSSFLESSVQTDRKEAFFSQRTLVRTRSPGALSSLANAQIGIAGVQGR